MRLSKECQRTLHGGSKWTGSRHTLFSFCLVSSLPERRIGPSRLAVVVPLSRKQVLVEVALNLQIIAAPSTAFASQTTADRFGGRKARLQGVVNTLGWAGR
jgi:hypothetical protein